MIMASIDTGTCPRNMAKLGAHAKPKEKAASISPKLGARKWRGMTSESDDKATATQLIKPEKIADVA